MVVSKAAALSDLEKARRLAVRVAVDHARALKINAELDARLAKPEEDSAVATCKKKHRFASGDVASLEASRRMDAGLGVFSAYLCPVCGEYHLTSKRNAASGPRKARFYLRRMVP